MSKVNIFWHRRDLRIEDNAGLYYALSDEYPVLPIFIFDQNILEKLEDPCDARVTFIHDYLTKIKKQYNLAGGELKVYFGRPIEVYKSIIKEFDIQSVYTNRDYEPYANERDQAIEELLKTHGINFYSFKDQVIFERREILTDAGEPYKVFTPYKRRWLEKFQKTGGQEFLSNSLLKNLVKASEEQIISLEDLGFKRSEISYPSEIIHDKILENYGEKRDFPALNATSKLGVHLRFGTVSIRSCVKRAVEKKAEVWLSELIWREFYMMILAHYPEVVDQSFKSQYDRIKWLNDEVKFKRWCEGKTGFPIVDAGMRELNATGYMHNRVRMVVASFLTKHLLIDWRWGEQYFAAKLLDFELSSNNGGWQWAAGTGTDAQPYFRVFNPESQQEKFDQEAKYIKKWVPEYGTPHYVKPIVDHKTARVRAIETYKEALS